MLSRSILPLLFLLLSLASATSDSNHYLRRHLNRKRDCPNKQNVLTNPNGRSGKINLGSGDNSTGGITEVGTASVTPAAVAAAASSTPASSGDSGSSGSSSDGTDAGGPGTTGVIQVSFTRYGTGDSFGSSSCKAQGACPTKGTGYTAAISQFLYNSPSNGVPGSACNSCWKLTSGGTSIVVEVDNECPAQGNPLCAQTSLTDTNQMGKNANFDLCADTGAADALLGGGVGLGTGTAQKVACGSGGGGAATS